MSFAFASSRERIYKAADEIVTLEFSGHEQANTLRSALLLISRIQITKKASGLERAIALVSNSAGKLSRELGQPSTVSTAHHMRAYQMARQLHDPDLALEAVLNIAHCTEVDFPSTANRALRTAEQIAMSSPTGPYFDEEWALINIHLRRGQLLQELNLYADKTALYQNIIIPRMLGASNMDPNSYAIGLVGFSEHMLREGRYDTAWNLLQDRIVRQAASQRTLIEYQVVLLRGRIYALTGEIDWAERELHHANNLRITNQLAPSLAKKLVAAIAKSTK